MKRIGALISLLLLVVMLSASFCFAGAGLELKESYPENGAKNVSVENSGVKLYFNENTSKKYAKENLKYIKLTDSKGKKQPIQVLYHPKEKGLVLVLLDKKVLEAKSDYTLVVDTGFKSANGDLLKKPIEVTFKTIDTSMNMTINMVMMVVMFGGIMFYSSRSMKKQMAEEQAAKQKDDKVNPYKVSKETGKSVQEVIEKEQREKEKKAKEEARKNGKHKLEKETDGEKDFAKINHYKVKGSKPISQGGGTYITGRKAKREAEAKARAAKGTTKPKSKKSKHK